MGVEQEVWGRYGGASAMGRGKRVEEREEGRREGAERAATGQGGSGKADV
jgi:hypothetical protein